MTGHRSVYPSQVLAIEKSPSIDVETGKEMEFVDDIGLKLRSKSITGTISRGLKKFRKK